MLNYVFLIIVALSHAKTLLMNEVMLLGNNFNNISVVQKSTVDLIQVMKLFLFRIRKLKWTDGYCEIFQYTVRGGLKGESSWSGDLCALF